MILTSPFGKIIGDMAPVRLEKSITGEYILPECNSITGVALRRGEDGKWRKREVKINGRAYLRPLEYEHQGQTYWRVQARVGEEREASQFIQIRAPDWQEAVRPCRRKEESGL